ncbi:helix-hairpin-helix domain-containing protein [Arthrobacter sp. TMT4-20]
MARHRWATSPPPRGALGFRPDPIGAADPSLGYEDSEALDPPGPPADSGRRWAIGRGVSFVVLGLALAIAFGLFLLRGAPAPEITSVALDSPFAGQPAPPVLASGAPASSKPTPSGAPYSGTLSSGTLSSGAPPAGAQPAGAPRSGAPPPGEEAASERLLVHVAGAVTRPGIVELASGSRVFEAIDQAGGALPDADLAAINLAAQIQDGLQIRVPLQGETPAPVAPDGAANGGSPANPLGSTGPAAPVNINTAGVDELETLPRIGPVLAERIVQWRAAHGAFTRPEDLDAVPGIGEAMLAALLPLVSV